MALPNNLVYPKAQLRLLNPLYRPSTKLVALERLNLHSTASQATSQFSYFNSLGKASSHLHLDKVGRWEQYQYLDLQSEADLDGNPTSWSIETQGVNPDDEPWTDAQITALVEFFRWGWQYGLPNKLATNSQPGPTSWGLSSHRLGVNGNFPNLPSVQAGRLQRGGGRLYSAAAGKICPGYIRQAQVPTIYSLAQGSSNISTEEDMRLIQRPDGTIGLLTPNGVLAISDPQEVFAHQAAGVPGPAAVTAAQWDLLVGSAAKVARLPWVSTTVSRDGKSIPVIQELADSKTQATVAATRVVPVDSSDITVTAKITPEDKQDIVDQTVAKMPKTLS